MTDVEKLAGGLYRWPCFSQAIHPFVKMLFAPNRIFGAADRSGLVARIERSEIRDILASMVRYRRNFVAGATYFFTVTLFDRQSTALIDHVDVLRAAFRATRHSLPFAIDAVVVLPDHLHIVMTLPPEDADFSSRLSLMNRRFTTSIAMMGVPIPRHRNGEHTLWQRRFWEHTIRDDNDFERHVDYIHFNPVKHGLVGQVRDWPHSSFHRYVRGGLLPEDWAGDFIVQRQGGFGERAE